MKHHRVAMPNLLAAASNRAEGYLDAVQSAAIELFPTHLVLTDTDYNRLRNEFPPLRLPSGPGTELKKLLRGIGIVPTPGCSCNARAAEMDARGCDWCETNIDLIVGWLRDEAHKRKLPFVDLAGRLLVKRAISNARKAELDGAG